MGKRLVVASANKGKLKEIQDMLPDFKVLGYKDLGYDFEIEENGKTFYENALIKARTIGELLKMPVLADDSGLQVKALNGEPGIYSARYSGDGIDSHNIDKLLSNMENVLDREAQFNCTMVYYDNGKIITESGIVKGKILSKREGDGGFGYDPIFYSLELKKSFGLASSEEKNSVSHRARALVKIKERLKDENN